MQGFVAAGVGVSLIAELGLTTVRDDIVVRDLGRDTPVRQIYAATLAEGYRVAGDAGDARDPAGRRGALRVAAPEARARRLTRQSVQAAQGRPARADNRSAC